MRAVDTFFTQTQRRVLAAAATLAALGAIILLVIFGIQQLARLVSLFAPMLWPLATAGILAMLLQPVVGWMESKLGFGRVSAVVVLYGVVLVVAAVVLIILVPLLYSQLQDLGHRLPVIWEALTTFINERVPLLLERLDVQLPDQNLAGKAAEWAAQLRDAAMAALPSPTSIGSQVLGFFGAVAGLAIIPVYLFFFLQTSLEPTRNLGQHLPFLKEETREDVVFLIREFITLIVLFFRGQLVIGLIMGVILATGFSAGGLKFGLLIGLAMGLLNIVPYLGSILGMAIALPTAFFQPGGGWVTALVVLAVFAGTQMLEGWYLTPKIMGKNTGLHPVVIILAIFFWGIALGGILGMILAIPLTAFFVTAWRLAKRKYIKPLA
jgi:predicted PurR-regulated permease PerM